MNYSAWFWNLIAEGYAKKPVADEAAYQKKLTTTQSYLKPNMKVLEFGCGTGSTAILHAPLVAEYQAIDVSPKMIAIAQRKLSELDIDNLKFDVAPIEEFNVQDQTLDAVLGMSILHLVNDHKKVIQEVYRMLKPGGVFISNTQCVGETKPFLRYVLPVVSSLRLIPKINVLSHDELENCMRQESFNIDHRWVPESDKEVCFLIASKAK